MLHNHAYGAEESFESYQNYLDGIQDLLPGEVYEFARDPARHDLGEASMHDSVVQSVNCECDPRPGSVTVVLLGPCFDRTFTWVFSGVPWLRISQNLCDTDRDLLTWEVGHEKGTLVFRAEFSGEDTVIELAFVSATVREDVLDNDPAVRNR